MPLAAMAADNTASVSAEQPMVGGARMYPNRNIVQNAANSRDHTALVAPVLPCRRRPRDAADFTRLIRQGRGLARLTTVQGGILTARLGRGRVTHTDAKGGMTHVTQVEVMQSNGVIHVTDAVSLPG